MVITSMYVLLDDNWKSGKSYSQTTLNQVAANHQNYSKKHGYYYHFVNKLLDKRTGRNGNWQKPTIIENLLFNKTYVKRFIDEYYENTDDYKCNKFDTFDYVFWIDIDALFMNYDTTIEDIINHANHMYKNIIDDLSNISLIAAGAFDAIVNNGVMIWKKTQFTKLFLHQWKNGPIEIDGWFDQASMIALMIGGTELYNTNTNFSRWKFHMHKGLIPSDTRQKALNSHQNILHHSMQNNIVIVEQNTLDSNYRYFNSGDFVLHFAGLETKLKQGKISRHFNRYKMTKMR